MGNVKRSRSTLNVYRQGTSGREQYIAHTYRNRVNKYPPNPPLCVNKQFIGNTELCHIAAEFQVYGYFERVEAQYRDCSNSPLSENEWQDLTSHIGNTSSAVSQLSGLKTSNRVELYGLSPGHFYEIRVRAVFAGVFGPWSKSGRIRTPVKVNGAIRAWNEAIPYPTDAFEPNPNEDSRLYPGAPKFTIEGGVNKTFNKDPYLHLASAEPDDWNEPKLNWFFVDNTHPNATDGNSSDYLAGERFFRGYPGKPRKTLPFARNIGLNAIQPGDHIIIDGGNYHIRNSGHLQHCVGTPDNPVWFRGRSPARIPRLYGKELGLDTAKYLIVENILWEGMNSSNSVVSFATRGVDNLVHENIIIRRCIVRGCNWLSGGGGIMGVAPHSTKPGILSGVVLYENAIYENDRNVDWLYDDYDHHGVGIAVGKIAENDSFNHYIWITDCFFERISGNGIQVITDEGFLGNDQITDQARNRIRFVFGNGNRTRDCRQAGVWAKRSSDIIYINNDIAYAQAKYDSGNGQLMGVQYQPTRVWFIQNRLRYGYFGYQQTAPISYPKEYPHLSGSVSRGKAFVLENAIMDIETTGSTTDGESSTNRSGYGIAIWREGMESFIVNNTVYRAAGGTVGTGGEIIMNDPNEPTNDGQLVQNNIFALKAGILGNEPTFRDPVFHLLRATQKEQVFSVKNNVYYSEGRYYWLINGAFFDYVSDFDSHESNFGITQNNFSLSTDPFNRGGDFNLRLDTLNFNFPIDNTFSALPGRSQTINPWEYYNRLYRINLGIPSVVGAQRAIKAD